MTRGKQIGVLGAALAAVVATIVLTNLYPLHWFPSFVRFSPNHREMNAAVERAHRELPHFIAKLQDPTVDRATVWLKAAFPVPRTRAEEHIWLDQIRYDGRRFSGRIANDPVDRTDLHFGDVVSVEPAMVSDWKYHEDGRIIGAYTLRVVWNRMSWAERALLEEALGARF